MSLRLTLFGQTREWGWVGPAVHSGPRARSNVPEAARWDGRALPHPRVVHPGPSERILDIHTVVLLA